MTNTATDTSISETETSLILRKNPSHNVLAHIEEAKNSLVKLATVYLVTEAAGHSQATLDAKRRDLQRSLSFYHGLYKHDPPDEWFVSGTKAFLKALPREGLALDRDQYTTKGFERVQVKGGGVRDFVLVHRDARKVLDGWLEARKDVAPPLFITRTGRRLSRREAAAIIQRMAAQAKGRLLG